MSTHPTDLPPDSEVPPSSDTASFLGLVASGAWKLATGAPRIAAELAHKGFSEAERLALTTLRKRMDAVSEDAHGDDDDLRDLAAARPAAPSTAPIPPRVSASTLLARLLEDSVEQTTESARERLALRLVKQLLPDEARILSDGHGVALVHLGAGALVGPATQRWLENLSPVGRDAGVRLLDQTPAYVTHLRRLGLLESGEEDKSLQLKYQLIEADTLVRNTCSEIERSGLRPRFIRRTLRMSDAGKAFWLHCGGSGKPGW
jgi:hypothetical protein